LRVKCAQRRRYAGPDPHDAFFHAWPKQSDPKLTAKKQLWPARGGWAARVSRAVMQHLLDCRGCMIDGVSSAGRIAFFVHLGSTTHACGRLDVIFCCPHGADRIFAYTRIHRAPDCVRC
jgi:hypothetical protein